VKVSNYASCLLFTASLAEQLKVHALYVGGLEFKFWTSQILQSIANGLPQLQHLRK